MIGAILAPTTLFINLFANFKLPLEMQKITPLIPALQSNWLMMHVTVMILSYAALICGALFSISFLILSLAQNWFQNNLLIIQPDFKNTSQSNMTITKNKNSLSQFNKSSCF